MNNLLKRGKLLNFGTMKSPWLSLSKTLGQAQKSFVVLRLSRIGWTQLVLTVWRQRWIGEHRPGMGNSIVKLVLVLFKLNSSWIIFTLKNYCLERVYAIRSVIVFKATLFHINLAFTPYYIINWYLKIPKNKKDVKCSTINLQEMKPASLVGTGGLQWCPPTTLGPS